MDVKETRREEIAKAARELFAQFGYKPVSMEQIASKANVAKGTVYLYYKDKEDLFFQLVHQFFDELMQLSRKIDGNRPALFQQIHEFVYNMLMYRTSQKFLYTIANEAKELKTPAACTAMKLFDDVIMRYIREQLETAVADGIIKPCNTSILAFVVVNIYSALAFEWEETHEPLNEKQIAESVSVFLKDGLLNTQQ